MGYNDWFNNHADKHKKIVSKLIRDNYTQEQIIDYFDFDNMVIEEREFCPLYDKNKRCHDMESLNCYLCACPNFRFSDEGIGSYNEFKILSKCNIHNGKEFVTKGVIHQDCSSCSVPHHRSYVVKHFDLDWKEIMSECQV
ncbi:MAG: hypothetical protein U9P38_08305 [Campylobacterota bacterium]|nr:hypothetical protein [Campylobacterota bacterium]